MQDPKNFPTKFCYDCKYYDYSFIYQPPLCLAIVKSVNAITGNKLCDAVYYARSSSGQCGPDAKLYKPTKWVRFTMWMKKIWPF